MKIQWPFKVALSDAIQANDKAKLNEFQAMAKKIVALYQLANEQLSKQHHYEWGLRSLKAVIKLAAMMRNQQPDSCESVILIQALHQINLSKLIFEDIPLFLGLIKVILSVC